MGYRQIERPKPIRRVLQDTTTPNRTYVKNGATANLAVPCWYLEVDHPQHTHVHDREWHDHIGWPDPDHPDRSSQDAYVLRSPSFTYDPKGIGWNHVGRYLDLSKCVPIHLEKEGYTGVDMAFTNKPQGLVTTGSIDDYVVRFRINPMCPDAVVHDLDVPYAVFVTGRREHPVRDIVASGILHIIAGPFSSTWSGNTGDSTGGDTGGNTGGNTGGTGTGGGNIDIGWGPGGTIIPGN